MRARAPRSRRGRRARARRSGRCRGDGLAPTGGLGQRARPRRPHAQRRGLQLEVADLLGGALEPDPGVELALAGELDGLVELDGGLVGPLVDGSSTRRVGLRAAAVELGERGAVADEHLLELARCAGDDVALVGEGVQLLVEPREPLGGAGDPRVGLVDPLGRGGELAAAAARAARRRRALGGDAASSLGESSAARRLGLVGRGRGQHRRALRRGPRPVAVRARRRRRRG
jgi:hypothetical protein